MELADAVDDLREHQDAQERDGPQLPAPLKELFLPSGNNETPLSIYGALAVGYSKILGDSATAANGAGRPSTPGGFYFGEFTPDFLLKLNDWILLEAEIGIGADGSVSAGSFAQADFFVNDWLTIIAGRFVAPIGFFNERLNNPWINKLPGDAPGSGPLLWQQVLPAVVVARRAGPGLLLPRLLADQDGVRRLRLQRLEPDAGDAGQPDHRRAGQPREHGRTPSTSSRTTRPSAAASGSGGPKWGWRRGVSAHVQRRLRRRRV